MDLYHRLTHEYEYVLGTSVSRFSHRPRCMSNVWTSWTAPNKHKTNHTSCRTLLDHHGNWKSDMRKINKATRIECLACYRRMGTLWVQVTWSRRSPFFNRTRSGSFGSPRPKRARVPLITDVSNQQDPESVEKLAFSVFSEITAFWLCCSLQVLSCLLQMRVNTECLTAWHDHILTRTSARLPKDLCSQNIFATQNVRSTGYHRVVQCRRVIFTYLAREGHVDSRESLALKRRRTWGDQHQSLRGGDLFRLGWRKCDVDLTATPGKSDRRSGRRPPISHRYNLSPRLPMSCSNAGTQTPAFTTASASQLIAPFHRTLVTLHSNQVRLELLAKPKILYGFNPCKQNLDFCWCRTAFNVFQFFFQQAVQFLERCVRDKHKHPLFSIVWMKGLMTSHKNSLSKTHQLKLVSLLMLPAPEWIFSHALWKVLSKTID